LKWHVRFRWVTAVALVLTIALPVGLGGCFARGKEDVNTYVVKESGKVIGSQKVRIKETGSGLAYSCTEKRPFAELDTTFTRELTVAKNLKTMLGYKSSKSVPGAVYRTDISATDQGFSFFAYDPRMFDYLPLMTNGKNVIPIEIDSACLMQALLDRFLVANVQSASAFVVVPSRGPVVRQVTVDRKSRFLIHLAGVGLDDVDVSFDRNNFVTRVRALDVTIEKGSAAPSQSKSFEPVKKAGRVSEVRVDTPERLHNGDRLELAGNLYLPPSGKKPYRAVILTGDAGPQDRTGGGFLSQVADALAGQGFAVLTCDRRGVPESAGNYATITRKSLLSDLDSQVDYLVCRGDMDPEKIALVGYGEGGLISASVAAANPYVKRVALMATPSVKMFPDMALTSIQIATIDGKMIAPETYHARQCVEALIGLVYGTAGESVDVAGHKIFLEWMRSWMASNPPADLSALKVPVLVMHGAVDRVVPVDQASEIMKALETRQGGEQKLEVFDNLGHTFGPVVDEAKARPYRSHPVVDRKVLVTLSDWLKK